MVKSSLGPTFIRRKLEAQRRCHRRTILSRQWHIDSSYNQSQRCPQISQVNQQINKVIASSLDLDTACLLLILKKYWPRGFRDSCFQRQMQRPRRTSMLPPTCYPRSSNLIPSTHTSLSVIEVSGYPRGYRGISYTRGLKSLLGGNAIRSSCPSSIQYIPRYPSLNLPRAICILSDLTQLGQVARHQKLS